MAVDLRQSGPWIGLGGMATTLFLYAWSAIALPQVVTLVFLPSVWLLLLVLALVWASRFPYRVLALPFVAAAVWFAAMLGWVDRTG